VNRDQQWVIRDMQRSGIKKYSGPRCHTDHGYLLAVTASYLLQPVSGLLRHTGKMLIAASFRT